MKKIFYNSGEQRIRAFWRILLQTLILAVLAATLFLGIVDPLDKLYKSGGIDMGKELFDTLMDIFAGVLFTFIILLSIKIAGKFFDKKKLSRFGFQLNKIWFKQYFLGLVLGAVLMTCIFLFELAVGFISIENFFYYKLTGIPMYLAFAYPLIKMLCVGIYEESLSRGYHFTNIKEGFTGIGRLDSKRAGIIAILITSVMFGIFHLGNPNASIVGVINTIVGGALLGTALYFSGQLAMSIGIHMSWNLFQGLVFGFPVSGDNEKANIIHSVQTGPEWITGGTYGPEAGLTGLIACIAGILILYLYFKLSNPALETKISDSN